MSIRSQVQGAVVVLAAVGLTLAAAGPAGARSRSLEASADGKFCGATRCVALPATLAVQLSNRDPFSLASLPKPAPYYRIDVASHAKWGIRQVFLWVPSRHLFRMTQYVQASGASKTPGPSVWRTANAAAEPALAALARGLKPLPATNHWH
jgi:hypothetical protein